MKLPIETDRWYNISKDHRKCTKCKENLIGDEFHYLFICVISLSKDKYFPIQQASASKPIYFYNRHHTPTLSE
jgi:hypothetical protein